MSSAEQRPRPQLSYLGGRQLSESGRHLLSEPSTPLSPPGPGECFFPTLGEYPHIYSVCGCCGNAWMTALLNAWCTNTCCLPPFPDPVPDSPNSLKA